MLGMVSVFRAFPVTPTGVKCPVLSPGKTEFVQCMCKEKKQAQKSAWAVVDLKAVTVLQDAPVLPFAHLLPVLITPKSSKIPRSPLTWPPTPPPCC